MAKDKTTLRFWLRTDRANKDGSSPIHLVYQIQGQRKYYAVPDTKLFEVNWNADDQKAVYVDKKTAKKLAPNIDYDKLLTSTDVAEFNSKLEEVKSDVRDVEKRFELDKIAFTPEMVIDGLKHQKQPRTKKKEPSVNVVDFITSFVKDSSGTHKPGTLKVYTGLANHLSHFEETKGIKITFSNIDIPLLRSFQGFLAVERKRKNEETGKFLVIHAMNNISIAKQISTLKTILNYARSIYKIKVNQDYRDFKVARMDSNFEVIALTGDELEQIANFDVSGSKRLERIKDVFLFSCYTSLRFSDLLDLKWEHINWRKKTIEKNAVKTGQRLLIPLIPQSYAILQKYQQKQAPFPLPMISNQKLNDGIKQLAKDAEINSRVEIVREYGKTKKSETFQKWQILSIHSGRKTFITDALSRGISPQDVMSISGHAQWKSFRRYYEITDKRKHEFMEKAYGSIKEDHKLKAV